MQQTIDLLKSHIEALEMRLGEHPEKIGGIYNRKHYSLKAQITNAKVLLESKENQENKNQV